MFVDEQDQLRRDLGVGNKPGETLVKRGTSFCIPMPAVGEFIIMIHSKKHDRFKTIIETFDKMVTKALLNPRFISDAKSAFEIAKELSESVSDYRDKITPMDALILSLAVTDQDCETFYTTDSQLNTLSRVSEIVYTWREDLGFPEMSIKPIADIIKM